jgi:RNA polymerase sigma-70 factor (ECF subfamily)
VRSQEVERADALAEIARAAVAGDAVAVRTFILGIGPHLLRSVRRVLGSAHSDVDDVAQECTVAVMDALPTYRGQSTMLHFACRIAVLTAMKALRRERARKRPFLREHELELDSLASSAHHPESELSARATAAALRDLLDRLPLEQAEALALHCALGFSVAEIASACEAPAETVRSRLRLAKHALRARILGDPRLTELLEESS